ncbi:MAG: ABC transporter ATP-binding protein [Candidatus Omnitrophica bacterium]|nr:ABC transporter ATP-binding protein [Candidatus Omnitrophota bacterium]
MLVELRGVKKHFAAVGAQNKVIKAVDGVDLVIKQGENLGLVGESGSGKTTLGRLILKLYDADAGSILFEGQDWAKLSSRELRPLRRKVQVVFQDPYNSLDPRFSIRAVLAETFLGQKLTKAAQEQRMKDMLKSVGLDEQALNRFPHEFSGGERQRIAIARSLLMNPKLLILDEAVSSLDVLIAAQIIELLKDLQAQYQVTYLFITHNLRVVKKLCQKIAVMNSGRIIEMAKTDDLFQQPLHPYTQELLSAALSYRSPKVETVYQFGEKSVLIDHGNGHFVVK